MVATDTMFSAMQDLSKEGLAHKYTGATPPTSSTFMGCALKAKGHTPLMILLGKKGCHPSCKAITYVCKDGVPVGSNAWGIGSAKQSSLNCIIHNKIQPSYALPNGSSKTARYCTNALVHPRVHGYMRANIWWASTISHWMKLSTG